MITPDNIADLVRQGFTDVHGEVSVHGLRALASALSCRENEMCIAPGPGETLRLTIPTKPKRTIPMGEG